jgi:hypothetical protein
MNGGTLSYVKGQSLSSRTIDEWGTNSKESSSAQVKIKTQPRASVPQAGYCELECAVR